MTGDELGSIKKMSVRFIKRGFVLGGNMPEPQRSMTPQNAIGRWMSLALRKGAPQAPQ